MRRVLVVARRVLRQRWRDRGTLVILLLQPLVFLGIFAFAFGADVADARVGIANLDRGNLGGEVLERLDREVLDVVLYPTEGAVEGALRAREVRAGVVFPANFTRNVEELARPDAEPAVVVLYLDNTNPQITAAMFEELRDALDLAFEEELDRELTFLLAERVVYGGEDPETLDFTLPGVIAFTVFFLGGLLTAVALVNEKERGTLERILASPAARSDVVLGYLGAFALFSLMQAASVLAVTALVFDVEIRGSVLAALVVTTLVGVSALGLGLFVSAIAENEFQAQQTLVLFAFPALFLSGVFVPLEAMPGWLRSITGFIPLTYAVDALRGIITYGGSLLDELDNVAILALFAAFFVLLGSVTFAKRP